MENKILNMVMPEMIPEPVPKVSKPMETLSFSVNDTAIAEAAVQSLMKADPSKARGSFKTHFEMRPDGTIMWATEPPDNIVTLQVDQIMDMVDLRKEDPAALDMYIKEELAQKLAQQMIEEDLIKIQYSDDVATLDRTYRATVKFVQE